MAKVLVLYYSAYGHIEAMANAIAADYPFDMAEPDPVGFLGRVEGVSQKDMALVAGGNAERLLGLPAKAKART